MRFRLHALKRIVYRRGYDSDSDSMSLFRSLSFFAVYAFDRKSFGKTHFLRSNKLVMEDGIANDIHMHIFYVHAQCDRTTSFGSYNLCESPSNH